MDETWQKMKKLADENRVITGALAGGAAGTVVPGAGTIAGALGGALVGFLSSKEKPSTDAAPAPAEKPKK